MSNALDIKSILNEAKKEETSLKKTTIRHHFHYLRDMSNFHATHPIFIALVNYESALLDEVDFLGHSNEHVEICIGYLENVIKAFLAKNNYLFQQTFKDFINASTNTKVYPKLKMAAASFAMVALSTVTAGLMIWFFSPPGAIFLAAILIATCCTVSALVATNYLLAKFYRPVFESEKRGNELCHTINRHMMFHNTNKPKKKLTREEAILVSCQQP